MHQTYPVVTPKFPEEYFYTCLSDNTVPKPFYLWYLQGVYDLRDNLGQV